MCFEISNDIFAEVSALFPIVNPLEGVALFLLLSRTTRGNRKIAGNAVVAIQSFILLDCLHGRGTTHSLCFLDFIRWCKWRRLIVVSHRLGKWRPRSDMLIAAVPPDLTTQDVLKIALLPLTLPLIGWGRVDFHQPSTL